MTTTTIEPGCNMPCISVSERHPGLWAYAVEATETGLVSALGDQDERRSDDRFKHLVFFPTFSSGEIDFHEVEVGQKVTVDAVSADTLVVKGGDIDLVFPNKIVVLYHGSLDRETVEAFYA